MSEAQQQDAAIDAATDDLPQPAEVDIEGFTKLERFRGFKLHGYDRAWDHSTLRTPQRLEEFVWDPEFVLTMLIFWFSAKRKALKLIGHTGAGKTEGVLQWHAALNLPLLFIGANPRTEAQQLVGMSMPSMQGSTWIDGPLVTAARYGHSILIDEYNLIDPGEASGLNAFLEGKPYTIPETGETIVPAPGFRIFATMNPRTAGYRGRNQQDMANDARFFDFEVKYLAPAVETPLVKKVLEGVFSQMPNKPDDVMLQKFADAYVETAQVIRNQYMGVNDTAAALPCTMCTRTLLTWAETAAIARALIPPNQSAVHWALRRVLSDRQSPEVREALHTIVTTTMGEPQEIASAST